MRNAPLVRCDGPTSVFLVAALLLTPHTAHGGDWVTAPSYYTHDPATGQRVTQHTPIGPYYLPQDPTFVRSGFRHHRSSIQVGTSADHYHVTEQWGQPVRPYGEWRFPYRPYSAPYDLWGPPVAGYGYWGGVGGYPGFGFGGAGPIPPGGPYAIPGATNLQPEYSPQQQLLDGRYPPTRDLDPFERKQLFDRLYPPQPTPPGGLPAP